MEWNAAPVSVICEAASDNSSFLWVLHTPWASRGANRLMGIYCSSTELKEESQSSCFLFSSTVHPFLPFCLILFFLDFITVCTGLFLRDSLLFKNNWTFFPSNLLFPVGFQPKRLGLHALFMPALLKCGFLWKKKKLSLIKKNYAFYGYILPCLKPKHVNIDVCT